MFPSYNYFSTLTLILLCHCNEIEPVRYLVCLLRFTVHLLWEQRVGGSNPLAPTKKRKDLRAPGHPPRSPFSTASLREPPFWPPPGLLLFSPFNVEIEKECPKRPKCPNASIGAVLRSDVRFFQMSETSKRNVPRFSIHASSALAARHSRSYTDSVGTPCPALSHPRSPAGVFLGAHARHERHDSNHVNPRQSIVPACARRASLPQARGLDRPPRCLRSPPWVLPGVSQASILSTAAPAPMVATRTPQPSDRPTLR